MKRIILMASNEGDLVLDPFVGGGTTVAVADKLHRRWIGIDQSVAAVKVTKIRLDKQQDLYSAPFSEHLHKYDYDTLRYKNAFEFESWIIRQYDGIPHNKKGGDKGIDGKTADGTPIQVKRSDNVQRDVIDKFPTAAKRYDPNLFQNNIDSKKPVGFIIAFSFSKGAIEEVARLQNQENVIVKLLHVDEIVPIAPKPMVTITMRELSKDAKGSKIEFLAEGHSEAGIEFYAWDFSFDEDTGFKPESILDKSGKQTWTFHAGEHTIAVKVVDNEGLESIETIVLKVNGVVEKV
jgi:site-specific DNA-methyltransferase (adenine-specific)